MAELLSVDTRGLSKLTSRNGISWIAAELIQNAWDQKVTRVDVSIESVGHGRGQITVTDDDPQGFMDLSHAYTLFAESNKMGQPSLRGRFNLGEKLVIAYCVETGGFVEILTTTGGYRFTKKDGRTRLRRRTEGGSKITAEFRASKSTIQSMIDRVRDFIHPREFVTFINGQPMRPASPDASFKERLPTLRVDDEGNLQNTVRKTIVEVFRAKQDTPSMIYELGIPVVENDTCYHINVKQKVPLNMERDSVTPAYRKRLCALVLNATRDILTKQEASEPWIATAMESEFIQPESTARVLLKKHGKKRLMHDPRHPEASAAAVAAGFTVVYGGNYSAKAHKNIRLNSPIISASTRFPDAQIDFDPEGKNVTIPLSKWTDDMATLASFANDLHVVAHGTQTLVEWINDPRKYTACYSQRHLTINYLRFGGSAITRAMNSLEGFQAFVDLLIHEFAHFHGHSHYSDNFYRGCTRIGAAIALHLAVVGLPSWLNNKQRREHND